MNILRNFKTTKGTELPLLNFKGKEYLEVKNRLVWFREDHPDWSIETEMINVQQDYAYAKATIKDEKGRIIATSHKFESIQGFPDFIEKAETGSIGRALALIGYGTQFCADELDEGSRIVDSPVAKPAPVAVVQKSHIPNIRSVSARPVQNVQGGPNQVLVQALVSRDNKDLAKNKGFRFDPIAKTWTKWISLEEFNVGFEDFDIAQVS